MERGILVPTYAPYRYFSNLWVSKMCNCYKKKFTSKLAFDRYLNIFVLNIGHILVILQPTKGENFFDFTQYTI